MTRSKILAGIAVVLFVGLAGGYLWVARAIQDKAERQVRTFLADSNLIDKVSYRAVETSLIGQSLTVKDIKVFPQRRNQEELSIEAITIDKLAVEGDRLESIRIHVHSLHAPAEAAKVLFIPTPRMADGIVDYLSVLGIERIPFDAILSLDVDPNKGSGRLQVSWTGREVAAVSLKSALQNVDSRLLQMAQWRELGTLGGELNAFSGMMLLTVLPGILKQLGALELEEASVTWKDKGIGSKLSELEKYHLDSFDTPDPRKSGNEFLNERMEELKSMGFSANDASNLTKAADKWLQKRSDFEVAVTFDQPVRIATQIVPLVTSGDRERKQVAQRLISRAKFEVN